MSSRAARKYFIFIDRVPRLREALLFVTAKLDARSTRNRIIVLQASANGENNNDARDGH
jgi:hypothetical protein